MTKDKMAPSSVDPAEIERFAALAADWWDPHGKFKPLHRMNPLRLELIRDAICHQLARDPQQNSPLQGVRLLDVGCGGGLLCEPLSRMGAQVTGIDAGETAIGVANAHAEEMGLDIRYQHTTAEALGEAGDKFEAIVSMEVVEHVADVDAFLKSNMRLLAPGGVLILSTLNRTAKSFAFAIVGAEYVLRVLPRGTHDWRKFLKPSELAASLRRAGAVVKDVTGMVYNPLTDSWTSGSDVAVNYMMVATRVNETV